MHEKMTVHNRNQKNLYKSHSFYFIYVAREQIFTFCKTWVRCWKQQMVRFWCHDVNHKAVQGDDRKIHFKNPHLVVHSYLPSEPELRHKQGQHMSAHMDLAELA